MFYARVFVFVCVRECISTRKIITTSEIFHEITWQNEKGNTHFFYRKSAWRRYLDEFNNTQDTHARTFGHTQPHTNEICSFAPFFFCCESVQRALHGWSANVDEFHFSEIICPTRSPSWHFESIFCVFWFCSWGEKVSRVILFQSDACICFVQDRRTLRCVCVECTKIEFRYKSLPNWISRARNAEKPKRIRWMPLENVNWRYATAKCHTIFEHLLRGTCSQFDTYFVSRLAFIHITMDNMGTLFVSFPRFLLPIGLNEFHDSRAQFCWLFDKA